MQWTVLQWSSGARSATPLFQVSGQAITSPLSLSLSLSLSLLFVDDQEKDSSDSSDWNLAICKLNLVYKLTLQQAEGNSLCWGHEHWTIYGSSLNALHYNQFDLFLCNANNAAMLATISPLAVGMLTHGLNSRCFLRLNWPSSLFKFDFIDHKTLPSNWCIFLDMQTSTSTLFGKLDVWRYHSQS